MALEKATRMLEVEKGPLGSMGNARTVFKIALEFGAAVAEVSPLPVLPCDALRIMMAVLGGSYVQTSGFSGHESLGGEHLAPYRLSELLISS